MKHYTLWVRKKSSYRFLYQKAISHKTNLSEKKLNAPNGFGLQKPKGENK